MEAQNCSELQNHRAQYHASACTSAYFGSFGFPAILPFSTAMAFAAALTCMCVAFFLCFLSTGLPNVVIATP